VAAFCNLGDKLPTPSGAARPGGILALLTRSNNEPPRPYSLKRGKTSENHPPHLLIRAIPRLPPYGLAIIFVASRK
jgi:hypothetical protein